MRSKYYPLSSSINFSNIGISVKNRFKRAKPTQTGTAETLVRAIRSQQMFKGTYRMHSRLKESKEFLTCSWIYQKSQKIAI